MHASNRPHHSSLPNDRPSRIRSPSVAVCGAMSRTPRTSLPVIASAFVDMRKVASSRVGVRVIDNRVIVGTFVFRGLGPVPVYEL